MENEDAQTQNNNDNDGEKQQRRSCGITCGSEPAHQADIRDDHYSLPEPEIDELFLDAIELRHECEDTSKPNAAPPVTAPSDIHSEGRAACGAALSTVC